MYIRCSKDRKTSKLLEFLKTIDHSLIDTEEAERLCKTDIFWIEVAYIKFRRNEFSQERNDRRDAIRILEHNSYYNIERAIGLATEFNVFNDSPEQNDRLWNYFIEQAKKHNQVDILLKFSDAYEDPQTFVEALEEETEIDDIYDNMLEGLEKVDARTRVMTTAKATLS